VKDPAATEALEGSQARIEAMAALHEMLCRSSSPMRIDLSEYLLGLGATLLDSYAADPGIINLEMRAEKTVVNIDTAIPLGLVANELLMNALKYAFPKRRRGTITLTLERGDAGRLVLSVCDDGVGLPTDFKPETTNSLGLSLVRILAEQVGGNLKFQSRPGETQFHLDFCGQMENGH